MSLTRIAKNGLESLGKNNRPIYTVVAIATANAIFKPLTSLTDKKEAPETRKYAALRELLTEVVAVPTYIVCSKIAEYGAQKAYKDNPEKMKIAKSNLGFIGVCAAAVYVIPAVCSLIVKPFTDSIYKKKKSKPEVPVPAAPVGHVTNFNANYHSVSMASFTSGGRLKI